MKKILVMIIFMLLFILLLTGCGEINESQESTQEQDMFVYIQKAGYSRDYDIVYHKDTKVIYTVSHGPYSHGSFTVLVNPDGTPMLYEEESEDKE